LTASASIPGVFSPMLIEVEADGRRSAEMHVDGGVTTNVLILPEALLVSGTPVFPPDARPKVYVVMNSKLAPDFEVVKASTLQIVRRSFETSVRANTRNTLLASYQFAKSRNWDFNLASIDSEYPKSDTIGFDLAYMHRAERCILFSPHGRVAMLEGGYEIADASDRATEFRLITSVNKN
jgi:hypothetical protein